MKRPFVVFREAPTGAVTLIARYTHRERAAARAKEKPNLRFADVRKLSKAMLEKLRVRP